MKAFEITTFSYVVRNKTHKQGLARRWHHEKMCIEPPSLKSIKINKMNPSYKNLIHNNTRVLPQSKIKTSNNSTLP